MTAAVRQREAVLVTVTLHLVIGRGRAYRDLAAGRVGPLPRRRAGGLMHQLAVFGTGGVPHQDVVGEGRQLSKQAERRDQPGQTPELAEPQRM